MKWSRKFVHVVPWLCHRRWLCWLLTMSRRTTLLTCLWWTCCRTGKASPGRATTGWRRVSNPRPSRRAFSRRCWSSACRLRRSQRWRCTRSGTWSPSGRVTDLVSLTTTEETLCWRGKKNCRLWDVARTFGVNVFLCSEKIFVFPKPTAAVWPLNNKWFNLWLLLSFS